jgi:hypothetical protein
LEELTTIDNPITPQAFLSIPCGKNLSDGRGDKLIDIYFVGFLG